MCCSTEVDLRWKDAKGFNAPLPHELAEAWRTAFMKYFREKKPREGNIAAIFDAQEIDYVSFLERALKESAIDLRVLLGTMGSVKLKSPNITSPTWAYMFSDFMMQQGYDGVVYNEGSEGWGNTVASFVFYNLKKNGTYESWKEQI